MDYKEDLKNKLPELKKVEGFPIGSDEDILALSEPPYYTACPNPYIADFIKEHGKPYIELADSYHKEPYLGDISESKEDTLYNLHTYHTKVPPKAIMKKILHYTEPGDIVLDSFSGTGMTGVASYLCSLPYNVNEVIVNTHLENISKVGLRNIILNELSPIASFISKNYSQGCNNVKFKTEATRILKEVDDECGWMFECNHKGQKGRIEYTVYSDVFVCPFCESDVVFWEVGVDQIEERNKAHFYCSSCNAELTKQILKRKFKTFIDDKEYHIAVLKPVLISYTFNGEKYKKEIDNSDLQLIEKIESIQIPYWYPKNHLPIGFNTKQPISSHGLSVLTPYKLDRFIKRV